MTKRKGGSGSASKSGQSQRAGHDSERRRLVVTLSPKSYLSEYSLHRVDGAEAEQLFTIDNVLSPEECRRLIASAEEYGFEHQGSRGPRFGEAFRDNHRIAFEDWDDFAASLWKILEAPCTAPELSYKGCRPAGLNPRIRLYKYSPGQKFGKHIDESNQVWRCGARYTTHYTLLVYLSGSDLVGGETIFYRGNAVIASVAPKPGMALLHLHGEECLEHEGAAVRGGVKYVLRSDVVFEG